MKMVQWRKIETLPKSGKFILAEYGPTNWAYIVTTRLFHEDDTKRMRELKIRYARGWAEMPQEPSFGEDENA